MVGAAGQDTGVPSFCFVAVSQGPGAEAGGTTATALDVLDGVTNATLDQDATAPKINTINTKNAQAVILVTFNERVTDETNAVLAATDFIYVNASGGDAVSISSIVHVVGEDYAVLTMNANMIDGKPGTFDHSYTIESLTSIPGSPSTWSRSPPFNPSL